MHETLSENFIGRVDSVDIKGDSCIIRGWAVSRKHDPLDFKYNKNLLSVEIVDRQDVYKYYKEIDRKYLKSGFILALKINDLNSDIIINQEKVFTIATDKGGVESYLRCNKILKPNLIVVDNFYENPDLVRKYALEQEFVESKQYHKGKRTTKSYTPNWIKEAFEKYLGGLRIKEFTGATGVFQYCTAQDQVVYHFDTQEYAAMVYLSPDAPLDTGTCTYRSKITGLFKKATDQDAIKFNKSLTEINALSFNGNNFYDRTNMELVDSIANVYNRMVIFNSNSLHSATGYYGSTKENSRLFHLFFFNCE